MTKIDSLTAQQKAEKKRSAKRKGTPTFSAVRFKDADRKEEIEDIISLHGGTREDALIAAFRALKKELKKV